MILNSNTHQAESETLGTEETINMTIDTSDQAALMMILSENLYKDAIGSLIRESASNALDAHKEAGVTQPIIVGLKYKNQKYVYSVQDFGTGISPDRVQNILSKYAASTKRQSNDYLGYYGLGFKAPLAYTNSFTFVTNYEGREYTYIMYKSEEGTKIDLVNDRVTEKGNGTTVSITVNIADYYIFVSKIKQQLAYFEGIYFEVPDIKNNFKVLKHEDWKYSDMITSGSMHLCLGDVYYDIDWAKLGMPPVLLPVGLQFSIEDGLIPLPSREDIKYTTESKILIKSKLQKVVDYFITKYNEGITEVDNFTLWNTIKNNKTVTIEERNFTVRDIEKISTVHTLKPTIKGVKLLDLEEIAKRKEDFFMNYEWRGEINGKFYGKNTGYVNVNSLDVPTRYLLTHYTPKGLDLAYLKDAFTSVQFLHKKYDIKLGKGLDKYDHRDTYKDFLNLNNHPKSEWRQRIKELQSILAYYIDRVPKIEDLKPTAEWLQKRKEQRAIGIRKKVSKEQITIKLGRRSGRGYDMVFDARIYGLNEVGKKIKKLIVYGQKEDKERFNEMTPLLYNSKRRVAFVILNKNEVKKVKDSTNFISIEEFMKGKTKPFKVFATAILIKKLIDTFPKQFNSATFIKNFSKKLAKDISYLDLYVSDNYPNTYYEEKDFLEEVMNIAVTNNLLDEEAMLIYERVVKVIKSFNFIEVLSHNYSNNSLALEVSREILKARKFKMDYQNYKTIPPPALKDPEDEEEEEETDFGDEEGEVTKIGSETYFGLPILQKELVKEEDYF